MRRLAVLPLLALLAPLSAAQTTHIVTHVGLNFTPADITIQIGDTIEWHHAGFNHTVTEGADGSVDGDELFHAPLTAGNPVVTVTFDEALVYPNARVGWLYDYFCAPHFNFGMVGTVTVDGIPLTATDNLTASVSAGGIQTLALDAGASQAGRPYLVLGSASGTVPGVIADGNLLPLNVDSYLLFTLENANTATFSNTFGFLDGSGQGTAGINVSAGLSAGLVGLTLHHAYATFAIPGAGAVAFTSNAVPLTLTP